jgi:class 3 adenylate cyclase
MSKVLEPSLAERATSLLKQHAWREAYDLLSEADGAGALELEDLQLLAQASWWVGQLPKAIETRERAYGAALKANRPDQATRAAIELAMNNLQRAAFPLAAAWIKRAERLLEGTEENPGHGWLAGVTAAEAAMTGHIEKAIEQATRAYEIAGRFGDRDLELVALSCKGLNLVADGRTDEGLALLDEATVGALASGTDPDIAGGVCCTSIGACAALGDWRRAAEWTEAQDRWCKREGISGYPGMCRLHRAELKVLRGEWLDAESEARRASDELRGFIPAAVGLALYEIGRIRLQRGDLPAAEESLLRAHSLGRDPEPALSLLRLAEGKVDVAKASIDRALAEPRPPSWWATPNSDLDRASLLPAQVEISLAAGDVATARRAADELGAIADRLKTTVIRATAACALGAVRVAEGDLAGGTQSLREGIEGWREFGAPYEVARGRMILARAYASDGALDRAVMELRSARAAFEELGAALDLRRANETLAALEGPDRAAPLRTPGQRAVKTFMFTDIVDSTKLAEILGDESWDKLIRWHDETLRSVVAAHGGQEIKAIGDGFFLAFDDADRALECAIAIQRRLATQRESQGFAPTVRIGVHTAEANRAGLDYTGTGVNEAARIGGAATGGEILVSADTLARARGRFAERGRRTAELKGIALPVAIVAIDWR